MKKFVQGGENWKNDLFVAAFALVMTTEDRDDEAIMKVLEESDQEVTKENIHKVRGFLSHFE